MSYSNMMRYILTIVLSLLTTPITTVYGDDTSTPTVTLGGLVIPNNQLPGYYPASFQRTGVLREIRSHGVLIVSGLSYQLLPNVLIHSMSTQHSSRHALRRGEEMGFSYSSDSTKKRTITEIWLLPSGSVPQY